MYLFTQYHDKLMFKVNKSWRNIQIFFLSFWVVYLNRYDKLITLSIYSALPYILRSTQLTPPRVSSIFHHLYKTTF